MADDAETHRRPWEEMRLRTACIASAREAAAGKRKAVSDARLVSAEFATDMGALHANLKLGNPERYTQGLAGMSRPEQTVKCTCEGCEGSRVAPACGIRPITKADFGAGLKNKPELLKELRAHGLITTGVKQELTDRLKEHAVETGAYYLTAGTAASAPEAPAPPQEPAEPTSTAPDDRKLYTRGALGTVLAPSDPLSPERPRMETRSERTDRVEKEVEAAVPRPYIREGIADDPTLAAAYSYGFSAVIAGCLRYSDYKRFMFARGEARKLTYREWHEVTSTSLYLSQRLLNDYIKAGIEVSRTVNEQVRTRKLACWREHWPLGQHKDRVRALIVDTCWPVPGYTSPHAMTHTQDALTQLVLAVCHLTKHSDDFKVPPPSAAATNPSPP